MKTFSTLFLSVFFCSIASINAMNNDDADLARAIAESAEQAEQDELKRALAESERLQLEQKALTSAIAASNDSHEQESKKLIASKNIENIRKIELDDRLVVEAGAGNIAKVKELITQGANIDAIAQDNVTPLLATLQGAMIMMSQDAAGHFHENYHELVKYFLERGANINHQDIRGNTALMHAVFLSPSVFKTILDRNPDISLLNKKSETILKLIQTTQASPEANPKVQEILRFDEKLAMLQDYIRKNEQADKLKIEAQAQQVLNFVVIPALANLIMDYVEGEYPLSNELQLPFMPREKVKKSGLLKADTKK